MALAAQQPREHVSAGVTAGPGARSQVRDVGPAHQTSPEERRSDLELVGVVLDGLSACCTHRPGLAALSRVLGDDASAAPASSPATRGALEQLQRKPHRAGIVAGLNGWFRTGHGREQHHEPMNHDTFTVRCSKIVILDHLSLDRSPRPRWVKYAVLGSSGIRSRRQPERSGTRTSSSRCSSGSSRIHHPRGSPRPNWKGLPSADLAYAEMSVGSRGRWRTGITDL